MSKNELIFTHVLFANIWKTNSAIGLILGPIKKKSPIQTLTNLLGTLFGANLKKNQPVGYSFWGQLKKNHLP